MELAQSPSWDAFAEHDGNFIENGFPFNEGFPATDRPCEVLVRTGQLVIAAVDSSQQYRADGLSWWGRGYGRIPRHMAAAWRELPQG